jgi:hypothetical protein
VIALVVMALMDQFRLFYERIQMIITLPARLFMYFDRVVEGLSYGLETASAVHGSAVVLVLDYWKAILAVIICIWVARMKISNSQWMAKKRAQARKAFDGEPPINGNAYCVSEAYKRALFAMRKANAHVNDHQLKVDKITVDHEGRISTQYIVVESSKSTPPFTQSQPKTTYSMRKLWRAGNAQEVVADGDVMASVQHFQGESRVTDAVSEEVDKDKVPPCIVAVGCSSRDMMLHAFRDGPFISLPWHGFYKSPELANMVFNNRAIFVRCLKTGNQKECKIQSLVTHNTDPEKMHRLRGSGLDSLCIQLALDDWSLLGAASLCGTKRSNPFMTGNGYRVVTFTQDFDTLKIYRSEGNILPDLGLEKHGLLKHTCNTEAGCSGTPLWSIVNGRYMWSGMHIGNWGNTTYNVAVSVSAYGHLRRLAGLVVKTPAVSQEMLDILQRTAPFTDKATLQKTLDTYLATVTDEVDRYDGARFAPTCPEQLEICVLEAQGHTALASCSTSSDQTRSIQSILSERDYRRMAEVDDRMAELEAELADMDEDAEASLLWDKADRRDHRDGMDLDYHQDRLDETREMADAIEERVHGEGGGFNANLYVARAGARESWADMFDDESISNIMSDNRVTPEFLHYMGVCKSKGTPLSKSKCTAVKREPLAKISEEAPAPSSPPDLLDLVEVVPKEGETPPVGVDFEVVKAMVKCESLPSRDQRDRDQLAKTRMGFDHANYASPATVVETESELYRLTAREEVDNLTVQERGPYTTRYFEAGRDRIAHHLIRDIMLGVVPLSSVIEEVENVVDYADLKYHPLLRDFWKMVDNTADRKDIDPKVLKTKSGLEAVSDGDPMARVVAEISPAFKGGATAQPQKLDEHTVASLQRVEARIRQELAETRDPRMMESLQQPPVNWDWALPPTNSHAVRDSLVSQLRRIRKGGFKNYPEIHQAVVRHWPSILWRYEEVDVTGDLDNISQRINDAFSSLDLTKSSGWSARVIPGTKQAWSEGSNRARIEEWVKARLLIHAVLGSRLIGRMSPYLLIKAGCKDPEELFIKMEAHKPGKQVSHRWRLIWNPSLLDTLILFALHVRTNKKSLESFEQGNMTHQVLGMGHHDEGVDHLGAIIDKLYDTGQPVTVSDATSWDFSVRRDGFHLDAFRRIAHTKSDNCLEKYLFNQLLLVQASLQSAHVVAIGTELVEILHLGILSSGILSTGETNSFLRTTYAFCAGAVATMACSDDLVAAGKLDLEMLANFGIIEPEVAEVPRGMPVSFTSHKFVIKDGRWVAQYDNIDKLFNGLILKNLKVDGSLVHPGAEVAAGQRFALRHNLYALKLYEKLYEVFGWFLPEADPFAVAMY